jgi:hypothetical protein
MGKSRRASAAAAGVGGGWITGTASGAGLRLGATCFDRAVRDEEAVGGVFDAGAADRDLDGRFMGE